MPLHSFIYSVVGTKLDGAHVSIQNVFGVNNATSEAESKGLAVDHFAARCPDYSITFAAVQILSRPQPEPANA